MSKLRQLMLRELQLRHYSKRTIESYISSLVAISKYYNQSPSNLTTDQIKDYLLYLIEHKHASRAMVNQSISALKLLWTSVLGRTWEDMNIKRPKCSHELPIVFSKDEVAKLLSKTRNLKHRTCLSLGYSAGLRVSEVCNLRLSDIDRTRMQIRVFHGKGSKTRYVPLAQNLLGLLDEYIHFYEPQNFFFEGRTKGKAISTETIGVIIRRSLRCAGIEKKASFHTLRHSYATHLLEQGVNLKAIQQLLGHSSLRSTSIYLHVQDLSKLDIKSPFDTL